MEASYPLVSSTSRSETISPSLFFAKSFPFMVITATGCSKLPYFVFKLLKLCVANFSPTYIPLFKVKYISNFSQRTTAATV